MCTNICANKTVVQCQQILKYCQLSINISRAAVSKQGPYELLMGPACFLTNPLQKITRIKIMSISNIIPLVGWNLITITVSTQ